MNFDNLGEGLKKVVYILMALFYIAIGGNIIYKKWFMVELSNESSWALGGLLIVYGVYRLYRAVTN